MTIVNTYKIVRGFSPTDKKEMLFCSGCNYTLARFEIWINTLLGRPAPFTRMPSIGRQCHVHAKHVRFEVVPFRYLLIFLLVRPLNESDLALMYQVEAANRLLGQCKLVFTSDTELNSPVILHDTQSRMQANNAHRVPLVPVFFSPLTLHLVGWLPGPSSGCR